MKRPNWSKILTGSNHLPQTTKKNEQKSLMQQSGEIIAELLDNDLETSETETSFEIDLSVMKFKHIVKKKTKNIEDKEQ
jgi:hypothetical protein